MRYPRDLSSLTESSDLSKAISNFQGNYYYFDHQPKKPYLLFDIKRNALLKVATDLRKKKKLGWLSYFKVILLFYIYLVFDLLRFFCLQRYIDIFDFENDGSSRSSDSLHFSVEKMRDMNEHSLDLSATHAKINLFETKIKLSLFFKLRILSHALRYSSASYTGIAQKLFFEDKKLWHRVSEIVVDEGTNSASFSLLLVAVEKNIRTCIYVYSPFTNPCPIMVDKVIAGSDLIKAVQRKYKQNIIHREQINSSYEIEKQRGKSKNKIIYDFGLAVGSDLATAFDDIQGKIISFSKKVNQNTNANLKINLSLHPQYRNKPEVSDLIDQLKTYDVYYRKEVSDDDYLSSIKILVSERSTLAISSLEQGKPTIIIDQNIDDELYGFLFEIYPDIFYLVATMHDASMLIEESLKFKLL